ncbi:Conserved_hypothetical protein [Hexamita inflata]|uniref:Uncharacterized protein n=1 Tax=Hexamita inflata TaxID=28002 RepID=A0ABP1GUB4_9EUKA
MQVNYSHQNVIKIMNDPDIFLCTQKDKICMINSEQQIVRQFPTTFEFAVNAKSQKYANNIPVPTQIYENSIFCNGNLYIQCFERVYILHNTTLIELFKIPDLLLGYHSSFNLHLFALGKDLFFSNSKGNVFRVNFVSQLKVDCFEPVLNLTGLYFQFLKEAFVFDYFLGEFKQLLWDGRNMTTKQVTKCGGCSKVLLSVNGVVLLEGLDQQNLLINLKCKSSKVLKNQAIKPEFGQHGYRISNNIMMQLFQNTNEDQIQQFTESISKYFRKIIGVEILISKELKKQRFPKIYFKIDQMQKETKHKIEKCQIYIQTLQQQYSRAAQQFNQYQSYLVDTNQQ